jgi:hypothetical protein
MKFFFLPIFECLKLHKILVNLKIFLVDKRKITFMRYKMVYASHLHKLFSAVFPTPQADNCEMAPYKAYQPEQVWAAQTPA